MFTFYNILGFLLTIAPIACVIIPGLHLICELDKHNRRLENNCKLRYEERIKNIKRKDARLRKDAINLLSKISEIIKP